MKFHLPPDYFFNKTESGPAAEGSESGEKFGECVRRWHPHHNVRFVVEMIPNAWDARLLCGRFVRVAALAFWPPLQESIGRPEIETFRFADFHQNQTEWTNLKIARNCKASSSCFVEKKCPERFISDISSFPPPRPISLPIMAAVTLLPHS